MVHMAARRSVTWPSQAAGSIRGPVAKGIAVDRLDPPVRAPQRRCRRLVGAWLATGLLLCAAGSAAADTDDEAFVRPPWAAAGDDIEPDAPAPIQQLRDGAPALAAPRIGPSDGGGGFNPFAAAMPSGATESAPRDEPSLLGTGLVLLLALGALGWMLRRFWQAH